MNGENHGTKLQNGFGITPPLSQIQFAMISILLAIGRLASVWMGFNIGGFSKPSYGGPAVGAGVVRKITAAALMTVFVFLGR
jgi:hypothetical protein